MRESSDDAGSQGAIRLAIREVWLIWVPLMGAGILGGFVLAARAGDEVPIVVAAVIGLLCVGSATLAVAAVVRPTPDKTFGPRRQGAEWLPDGSAWPLP